MIHVKLLTPFTETNSPGAKIHHVEIWGHLVQMNRSLKNMLILSAIISFVAVCASSTTLYYALTKPIIYYVDSSGQASGGGRLDDATTSKEVEVAAVTKSYLRGMIALNSLTVERDFATSFNLMTAGLQAQHNSRLDAWKEERGKTFIEFVRAAGIRTTLEFSTLDVTDHGGKQFSVTAKGLLQKWPLEGDGEAEPISKTFETQLTLVAVPRAEDIPNGLLVSHEVINYFEPKNAAQDLEDTKGLESEIEQ